MSRGPTGRFEWDDAKPPRKPAVPASTEDSDAVKIFRIGERHRTIRWGMMCGAFVLATGIICGSVIYIAERPWWEALIAAVAGNIVVIVGGQSGISVYLFRRIKRYTSLNQERIADMERERDPGRTSSGLMPDGSNPPEDLI